MSIERDTSRLESRYRVEKINDPTGKHNDCRYFVLDPQHDPFAVRALRVYAAAANEDGFTGLAADLWDWADRADDRHRKTPVSNHDGTTA